MLLCLSGHDPTGGAGLQADLEAALAVGVKSISVITALTAQDSHNVQAVWPTPADVLETSLRVLLNDIRPAAVKIGLLGSAEQIPVIQAVLQTLKVPVVCDPVLKAGGGTELASQALLLAFKDLMPHIDLLTPNHAEATRLSHESDPARAARALIHQGCKAVLITGGDEATVIDHYHRDGLHQRWRNDKLPQGFHGAGCTLASAIAARLALGMDTLPAIESARQYTLHTLQQARIYGTHPLARAFPHRKA